MGMAANRKWDRRAAAARGVLTTWTEPAKQAVLDSMRMDPRMKRALSRESAPTPAQRVVQPSRRGQRRGGV
jgi:hypothetical protein